MGHVIVSRRAGERIAIEHGGETLWITVVDASSRRRVKLSFSGPLSFKVLREELVALRSNGFGGSAKDGHLSKGSPMAKG